MKRVKKQEKKKELVSAGNYFFLPLSLFVLLLIGTVVSIVQLQHNQSNQPQATIDNPLPTTVIQNCDVTASQLQITSQEQSFFDQINAYRHQHGIAALNWSAPLQRATAWMSNDMLTHNSLSHIDSLGRDTLTRMEQCGFSDSTIVGENIDNGTSDYTILLPTWENAPAQNANLLSTSFTQAAIALATDAAGKAYWVMDFGGVSPTPLPTATPALTITSIPSVTRSLTKTPTPTHALIGTPTPTVTGGPTHGITTTPQPTSAPTAKPTTNATPTVLTPFPTFATSPGVPNTPTPTPVPFVANPNDTQVFVIVKLPGIGKDGNEHPNHLSRHVQVTVFDLTNKQVVTGTGYLRFDGNYFSGIIHLGKLADGTYYIKVIGDNTLQELVLPQFQTLSSSRLNMLPQVTLLQGDLNGDNVIDLNDFALLLACFQNQQCPNKDAIDFSDNGTVDIVDYNLFLQSFLSHSGD